MASGEKAPPTAEQIAAFLHLSDIEPSIAEAVVRALFERYLGRRAVYRDGYDPPTGCSRLAMRLIPFGWIAKQALNKVWFASNFGNVRPGPVDLDMLQSC